MSNEKKVGIAFAVVGIVLVGSFASWWASAGVFLMFWGHNLTDHP